MDIREYTSPTLPVAQFVERYVDTDHYDAGCRGCDNYGQVWVCPPYDFSVLRLLGWIPGGVPAGRAAPVLPGRAGPQL